jgi:hypothetical protein
VAHKKSSGASHRASRPATQQNERPADLGMGNPPTSDDPKAQAEYFMQMLDAFAQQGTPEAKRIRSALIEAVAEYGKAQNKAEAAIVLKAKVAGLEMGVTDLLVRATKKLRDRFVAESRKLGTSSKLGETTRTAADGFSMMVDGLEKLQKAAEGNDAALREEANKLIADARAKMEQIA